jgi:hypothetical protein
MLTSSAIRADERSMKRTMSTKTALVGLAASLAGLAVASVAYFGPPRSPHVPRGTRADFNANVKRGGPRRLGKCGPGRDGQVARS